MLSEPSFFALQPLLDTLDGLQCFLLLASTSRLPQVDPVHLNHDRSDDLLHLLDLIAAF